MKLKPKNWGQFQHYNKRTPPWIKLHRGLLDDFDYQRLPVASRALAPMLWLLASEGQDGEFDASHDYLTFRLRCSDKEITDGLKPLIDGGFFVVASGALSERYQAATPEVEKEVEKEVEVEVEKRQTNGANAPVEPAKKRGPDRSSESQEVFEYWQQELNHPRAKLDAKRDKAIKARLKDGYTVSDLKAAIDGIQKSAHHMGENDRNALYDDIELICRDGPHVDKFIKLANGPNLTRMSSAARKTLSAAQRWIENG